MPKLVDAVTEPINFTAVHSNHTKVPKVGAKPALGSIGRTVEYGDEAKESRNKGGKIPPRLLNPSPGAITPLVANKHSVKTTN